MNKDQKSVCASQRLSLMSPPSGNNQNAVPPKQRVLKIPPAHWQPHRGQIGLSRLDFSDSTDTLANEQGQNRIVSADALANEQGQNRFVPTSCIHNARRVSNAALRVQRSANRDLAIRALSCKEFAMRRTT